MELHVLVCPQDTSSCRIEPQMRIEEETGYKLVGLGGEGLAPPVLPHSGTQWDPRILNLNLASQVFKVIKLIYVAACFLGLHNSVLCHVM